MARQKDDGAPEKRATPDGSTADDSETDDVVEAPLPGEGTEEGERLRSAEAAFERGDYVEVRRLTSALLEAPDAAVAAHARDLLHRTKVDPIQVVVIGACFALFSAIAYIYVLP